MSYSERYGNSGRVNHYKFMDERRVVKRTESENLQSIKQFIRSVFLPQGYPVSVSEDYLEYQLWDTLQAFSSSITGALATQAVLKGVGVGDAEASVMAATITWLLKDGTGMVGRIVFAWMKGSSLDSDCKKWRMYADILNDAAILLDILSPLFTSLFTIIVCISGVMRSVVGVAGGATRAAITQHQSRRNNMADVAAKDGSQETLVNLAGLLVSLSITPLVSGNSILTWSLFATFTLSHLYCNYRAVTCLVIRTINQSRLSIIVADFVTKGCVPDVKAVNRREPVLFGFSGSYVVNLGCSYEKILYGNKKTFSEGDLFIHRKDQTYVLNTNLEKREVNICLKCGAGAMDQLKACYHAELIKMCLEPHFKDVYHLLFNHMKNLQNIPLQRSREDIKKLIDSTHSIVIDTWSSLQTSLVNEGWIMEYVMLNADEWRLKVE